MKRILPLLIFSLGVFEGYAQLTSCAQTLRLARSTYEQGRLYEVPTLLEKCLKEGDFSQQERVEAYKLLCLSYLYLEEPQKADEAMLNLLRTNHYFEINQATDPAEFIALWRTFRTTPIYRIGGKLGVNASQPNVKSYLPAGDGESKYSFAVGFEGGVMFEFPIAKRKLILSPGLNFQIKNFEYENNLVKTDLATGEEISYVTTGKESHSWISIPVMVQYPLLKKSKLNPYIALGASADYLMRAENTFLRTKEDRSSYEEQTEDIIEQRNKLNFSGLAAAGIKVKVPNGFATAELKLSYGLTQVSNEESLYDLFNKTIPTDGYVDGIFSINTVSFTLGYVYNVFNPKKLKR